MIFISSLIFSLLVIANGVKLRNGKNGVLGNDGSQNSDGSISISFSGGGFRAHAVHTGVIAGLSGVLSESSSTSAMEKLFQDVSYIGSNSGGSWFFVQLGYSKNFNDLIYDIGESNSIEAGSQLYNTKWIDVFQMKTQPSRRVLSELENDPNTVDILNTFATKTANGIWGDAEQIFKWVLNILKILWNSGFTWQDFVDHIIEVPGDINSSSEMGTATPQPFAKGIVWSVAGTALAPDLNYIQAQHCPKHEVKYLTSSSVMGNGSPSVEKNLPMMFSTVMGDASKDTSIPFISWAPGTSPIENTYTIGDNVVKRKTHANTFFKGNGNTVSFSESVSTSSSCFGSLGTMGFIQNLVNLKPSSLLLAWFLQDMPLHVSQLQAPKTAFKTGYKMIHSSAGCDQAKKAGDIQLLNLMDGGAVDNSALGHVLAATKNQVSSATLVFNVRKFDTSQITNLFQHKRGGLMDVLPMFKESSDEAQAQLDTSLKTLNQPTGVKYLEGIKYGTIEGTTVDEPLWNLKAGRKITVNVILVSTSLNIAEVEWTYYGTLVGEISAAMKLANNNDAVQTMIQWLKK